MNPVGQKDKYGMSIALLRIPLEPMDIIITIRRERHLFSETSRPVWGRSRLPMDGFRGSFREF
jgi:hypothetical protein